MEGMRGPSANVVGVCEAKLILADASLSSIRQLGSSASVPGGCAPVAGSDWHDRCLTHRNFCEYRLVDVKVRPDELVGGERQQLAKPQFLHAIAPEHPEEPQRRRALVHDVVAHWARHVANVARLVIEGAGVP